MHKDNYLDEKKENVVYVNPKEYVAADPYAENTLTTAWINALKATTSTSDSSTSTSASGSETTNVNITYSNDVVNVAMEKISYAYGISVASVEMVPLTSGITGTVYLDDIKNDSIEGTTVAKKAIVSFIYNDGTNDYVLGEATTDDDGVFAYYGLPTGVVLSTVSYKVDYTDETTKKYYTASGAIDSLNGKDTLIVNENGDTAKYFQAGKVNAVLTDTIKVTKDNFTGKVLNVTDPIELTFDHQLSKLTVTVGVDETKVALVNDATANTCTATITPIDGAFSVGLQTIALSDALATNGTTDLTYSVDVNFVEFKLVGMSVVDAIPEGSRMAVTASQYLKLEYSMEVGRVEGCKVGGVAVDAVIAKDDAKIVYIPFNDKVNSTTTATLAGTVHAKVSDSVTSIALTDITEKFFANQTNYIASTNLNSDGELSYGADLVLTFAADLGTYTDIVVTGTGTTEYDSSYDKTTMALTISRVDGTVMSADQLTIAVMSGTTTIYTTANKYFGQKASEASLATTANKVCFTVLTVPTPDKYKSTTAKDFKKTLNTSIVLTFDVDVSSYKALLLTDVDDTKDYDEVIADLATTIIGSTTTANAKTLTVAPAGNYPYDTQVHVAYYTKDGDYVGQSTNEYKLDVLDDYMTLLAAQTSTITASLSDKSVKDNAYTATFDFTPEYAYTKSGSNNTYALYKRTTSIRGIVGKWTLYNDSINVNLNDISIAKTATTSATGTLVDLSLSPAVTDKSVDFLLVTTVDNLVKSYYYAGFADTTKPSISKIYSGSDIATVADGKYTVAANPAINNTTTYTVTASEAIATATVVATFAKTTETVTNKQLTIGNTSFSFDVKSSDSADLFTAADYVTITVTDYAGNSSTVALYCK